MTSTTFTYPPTPGQVRFLESLAADRLVPSMGASAAERLATLHSWLESDDASKAEASRRIDWMRAQPFDRPSAPPRQERNVDELVGVGAYRRPDGEIFVVKMNRDKSRAYAQRMIQIDAERLTADGEHRKIEFEYDKGAIFTLTPDMRMSVEDGKALTILYGRCLICNRALKAAESVERGIGPVCIKNFG